MKPRWGFFFSFFCVAVVLCPAVLAAPKTPKGSSLPPGHRFLFVVETSATSLRLSYAVRQAVVDMIWSGLDGQMHPGDTYGLWTYNEEPRTGIFPMQTWTNTISLDLASQAGRFLRDQPYANRSRLDRLVEKLHAVIRVVKDVDIILVSGSDDPISNTPFDQQINAAWRGKNSDLRDAKKPLITTLTARNGKIINWSVTVAGEPIRLNERPALTDSAPASVTTPPPKTAVVTRRRPTKRDPIFQHWGRSRDGGFADLGRDPCADRLSARSENRINAAAAHTRGGFALRATSRGDTDTCIRSHGGQ
jgi:hypothetical protein